MKPLIILALAAIAALTPMIARADSSNVAPAAVTATTEAQQWTIESVRLIGAEFAISASTKAGAHAGAWANLVQMSAVMAVLAPSHDFADLVGKAIREPIPGAPESFNLLSAGSQIKRVAHDKAKREAAEKVVPLLAAEILKEGDDTADAFAKAGISNEIAAEILAENLGKDEFFERLQLAVAGAGTGLYRKNIYPASVKAWRWDRPSCPFTVFRMVDGRQEILYILQAQRPWFVGARASLRRLSSEEAKVMVTCGGG